MPNLSNAGLLINNNAQGTIVYGIAAQPDDRQIATFFLGWVFISSLASIVFSPVLVTIFYAAFSCFGRRLLSSNVKRVDVNMEKPLYLTSELNSARADSTRSSIMIPRLGDHVLMMTMSLCFAFASIANFVTLLFFGSNNASVTCSFMVAWAGVSSQCARSIGLLILSLELQRLGTKRWECFFIWVWILVGMAFAFATYALSVGVVTFVPRLDAYMCSRKFYLPISLVTSIIFLCLELYVVLRLFVVMAPGFLHFRHRLGAFKDDRFICGLTLIIFDLLTIVPAATFTGIIGEFIPFSLGVLIVLAGFNRRVTSNTLSGISTITSIGLSSPVPTIHPVMLPHRHSGSLTMSRHSASGRSRGTADTATARDIEAAVVQVASQYKTVVLHISNQTEMSLPSSPTEMEKPSFNLIPEGGGSTDPSKCQSKDESQNVSKPRRIVSSQLRLAERLEQELPLLPGQLPIRPQIAVVTSPPYVAVPSNHLPSAHSIGSGVYGSDIIRANSGRVDVTKRTSRLSFISGLTGPDTFVTSPASPRSSGRSARRHSILSIIIPSTPAEELPTLSEVSIEGSLGHRPPPSTDPGRATFGEQKFKSLGFSKSPSSNRRSSILWPATTPTSASFAGRTSRIRGPRPLPKIVTPTEGASVRPEFRR